MVWTRCHSTKITVSQQTRKRLCSLHTGTAHGRFWPKADTSVSLHTSAFGVSLNGPRLNRYDAVSLSLGGSNAAVRLHHTSRRRRGSLAPGGARSRTQKNSASLLP